VRYLRTHERKGSDILKKIDSSRLYGALQSKAFDKSAEMASISLPLAREYWRVVLLLQIVLFSMASQILLTSLKKILNSYAVVFNSISTNSDVLSNLPLRLIDRFIGHPFFRCMSGNIQGIRPL